MGESLYYFLFLFEGDKMLVAGVVEGTAAEPELLITNFAGAKLVISNSGSAAVPSTTPATNILSPSYISKEQYSE